MTYHIKTTDFFCPKCDAIYMPYSSDLPCPKCQVVNPIEDPRSLDFIERVLESMKVHKIRYGRYTPDAWYQGCYSEYLQSVIFSTFDNLEAREVSDPKTFIREYIMSNPDAQQYAKEHTVDIELKVYDGYMKNPNIKGGFFRWIKWKTKAIFLKLIP